VALGGTDGGGRFGGLSFGLGARRVGLKCVRVEPEVEVEVEVVASEKGLIYPAVKLILELPYGFEVEVEVWEIRLLADDKFRLVFDEEVRLRLVFDEEVRLRLVIDEEVRLLFAVDEEVRLLFAVDEEVRLVFDDEGVRRLTRLFVVGLFKEEVELRLLNEYEVLGGGIGIGVPLFNKVEVNEDVVAEVASGCGIDIKLRGAVDQVLCKRL